MAGLSNTAGAVATVTAVTAKRAASRRRGAQLDLPLRGWGGLRAGAGRKRSGARASVPHIARPEHKSRHPVHVTLRAVRRLPSLRKQTPFLEVRRAFALCSSDRFRLVHFSVQADHVHLIVEATDKKALSRGARGLAIRLARRVNGILGRRGRVWGDRYHARPLSTPREVRHALVYVLMNWKKHVPRVRGFDPCASGAWFDGWRSENSAAATPCSQGPPSGMARKDVECWEDRVDIDGEEVSPVRRSRTWLGSTGWRRHGLIEIGERPTALSR